MTTWIDANAWSGQFPFRRIAGTTVEELERKLSRLGFTGAVLSPLEAIFQEDSYGAEEALCHDIQGRTEQLQDVWHFKVVNPACNWWERDLRKSVEALGVSGIRLCPTFHGYQLADACVADLLVAAGELNLPVQVMCKMQDWRIKWMMATSDVEIDQVGPFLEGAGDHPLILSGLHTTDLRGVSKQLAERSNVLVDTSRLKGSWRTLEKLAETISLDRLCFGSLWPINLPDCPLAQIGAADIPQLQKDAIMGSSIMRILGNGPKGGPA